MCYPGEAVGPVRVMHGVVYHPVTSGSANLPGAIAFFNFDRTFQPYG